MSEDHPTASEAATMMDLIIQRYGSRLTPAALEAVRQGVTGLTQMSAALRQAQLTNSDEPGAVFIPYRQEG
jgi:hypothetical protein